MNWFQRFRCWIRHPKLQPWSAAFLWWMTVVNIAWCVRDVRERYDAHVKVQAARMRCEADGGFYGSPVEATVPRDRCVKLATETALADRRTR